MKKVTMVLHGFRFGMLLQISIGPVCVYIFKTATESGILVAESAVLAATIMDALFVTLAIGGVGSLLEKPKFKLTLKYGGTIVLLYFGVGIILGSMGIRIVPSFGNTSLLPVSANAFITSFILTASSPLSILFWTGVFATKITCEGYSKSQMKLFGLGAVSATIVFLGIFALVVGLFHPLMSATVVTSLNLIVGIVLIGFGVKMAFVRAPHKAGATAE